MKTISRLFYILCFISSGVLAQSTYQPSSSEILLKLKKLRTAGSVLYIAAHPDDENTRLLAYLANERNLRTGYLSLTRGDGGQNLIGKEQGELLGLIRTQELLAARRIDGAEQFFTRANDFGFSKNPEETLQIWDKDSVLADVVWTIRQFKPDIIICRFPTTGEGGHGHHTASAFLAQEAFAAAADPKKFPDQLKFTETWQAKRLSWNTFNFGGNNTTAPNQKKIDVGGYNPLMGKSYGEVAANSRSMHKSQGFGSAKTRGETIEYFKQILGDTITSDLFEGIDLSWKRVPAMAKFQKPIDQIIQKFDAQAPEKSVPALIEIYKSIQSISVQDATSAYWKKLKLKAIEELIVSCAGLFLEASAADYLGIPG
ncbi:MAG: PIG-L family deacetylase, partial [Cytophagales bacterium]|nr:PIG-L family deacetylase [Cytophagales bacterium]